MTLNERVIHIVQSQFDAQHLTQDHRVEAISHLITIEILAISTQFANYVSKNDIKQDYTDHLYDFLENHYGKN